MLSAEVLVTTVSIGLYLFDSSLMLFANEAVLIPNGKRWRAGFGSERFRFRGREFYLPNVLAPHRPVFRLAWQFDALSPSRTNTDWTTIVDELRWFAPIVGCMGIALFVLVPAGLFTRLGTTLTVAAVVVLYFCILTVLLRLCYRRRQLGLSFRRIAAISFESMACPPCALNIVRKLSVSYPVREDFTDAAQRLLSDSALASVHTECLARVDEEIATENLGTARMKSLLIRRDVIFRGNGSVP